MVFSQKAANSLFYFLLNIIKCQVLPTPIDPVLFFFKLLQKSTHEVFPAAHLHKGGPRSKGMLVGWGGLFGNAAS